MAEHDSRPRLRERDVRRKMAATTAPWLKDPKFLAEWKRWNKVLADSGLDDIEQHSASLGGDPTSTPYIKGHYLAARTASMRGALGGGAEFYRIAGEWMERTRFKTLRERLGWGMLANGYSARAVARRFGFPVGRMAKQIELMLEDARIRAAQEGAEDPTLDLEWYEMVDAMVDGDV
jgi:hypothetical protein